MARLLSVNVGLPRDIEWQGRTVHTGIWKDPVPGRCQVRRLNLDGDGQGDLAGHGGEQRAVYVYQIESYHHWQSQLKRADFVPGQFGENFTVEGLTDDVVCIGDRYQIGSAIFEVSQPRVTCYRLGIRMNEPQMAALLTSSDRPGFYFRVIREGDVGAGDEIVQVARAAPRMTVAEINALLYSSHHPPDRLKLAVQIQALSPGFRASFEALQKQSHHPGSGNFGLIPADAAHAVAPGFRTLTVTAVQPEAEEVLSLTLQSADGRPLPTALPGQYLVLRLRPSAARGWIFRSYSLSGPVSSERYRISVKVEPNGAAGFYLSQRVRVGDSLDVSAPRGSFVLQSGEAPVVLLSAGIGATPVLAMLHALVAQRSTRRIFWIQGARDRQHHPFAAEVPELMRALTTGQRYICYSRPGPSDIQGRDFDGSGRLSRAVFDELGVPPEADVYLCRPNPFMAELKQALAARHTTGTVYSEVFGGGESMTPGIAAVPPRAPHVPEGDASTGALVSFARSGISAHWKESGYSSLLELAEACDVPVRWSCRAGVCHSCESGLVSGDVVYGPTPLDEPAAGNVLICCSRPKGDLVLDL